QYKGVVDVPLNVTVLEYCVLRKFVPVIVTTSLTWPVQVYRAYLREEERLRDQGADIRRVVLESELKREYQEWLQESNRGRPDSDGRPDREERDIERWAHEHDLPYFDDHVHFPDFRLEHELHGREHHQDVEVVTEH